MQDSTTQPSAPADHQSGAAPALAWRGLGRREDLDIDFRSGPRSAAVARVLSNCAPPGGGRGEDDALRLTLAARIGALLAIDSLTRGTRELQLAIRCAAGCGGSFEAALPIAPLIELARDAERSPVVELHPEGAPPLRLRRPTGRDQRRWQERRYASADEARRSILRSLAVDPLPEAFERNPDALGDAMEQADPLPSFRVTARCPLCEADAEQPVDLEAVLLERLARAQRSLLRDVHRLALRYGWSETEVFEVPEWRRREYLRLLDEDAEALR